MTKTMQTALATLAASPTGTMPLERAHRGWNLKAVYALLDRGVLKVSTHVEHRTLACRCTSCGGAGHAYTVAHAELA